MYCYFCKRNIDEINFRDTENLQRYISKSGKIKPKKKTGACSKHQREISTAIKRARIMGLLPFVAK
ncbi:MAG: 30S ribosomal protein S18 [Candidatus Pacebacteria bacterium]|jgi:small subunit ribosomal protein S18|nr:30S ribosomal protein S18 [Candidatus Paceibacterota bacterium]MDD2757359.1 30S ribosomal protein S18 [Candidatus Paceibacterota bacterium]MDD3283729.1 30S ribosomal protein S18 [Candidatus Paceibacterota bacterium]MDD3969881.1 30S ribosomal protein S18 [Candidatus Paceibacterota bacterium]MDD4737973.1 30S ribosomal protein S18 [Candidatus Paceibacterota bacterium]